MTKFYGYRRPDGSIGIRNHVIVINTVGNLSALTRKVAGLVPGVIPVIHHGGESQFPEDYVQTLRTLVGTAGHSNVSAALVIGMEDDRIAQEIEAALIEKGKPVRTICLNCNLTIQEMVKEGKSWLSAALENSKKETREQCDITELIVGLECGGSDAWSGITANPSIGAFSDMIVHEGGTSVLAETTEAIGAEHILASNAINHEVGREFLTIVRNYDRRIKETGEDIRSANPTPGNMAGGLTTLEEKSLGCIKKGGSTPLREVISYSEMPSEKGFVFMDTPGYDVESVCGLAAGGAQIVLFSTGKGSPTGSPIVPVIKIGTNPKVYEIMSEHIDINAGKIIDENKSIKDIGKEIFDKVIDVSNGEKTAAENQLNQEFAIWRLAESI
ncbi:UxaA family hydrolase [Sporosarcina aquimarina]|uniref:UxaA family hydrolase n=1 Tax=Sporosarcina aquimarina TaxID=114975 RepID=UPI001C8CF8A4|nr:UxaA family hydrolase [Sporosarcina aquimarina]MBY0223181.1 UxaA family hydrolase [Sporosarcina aquimarina]